MIVGSLALNQALGWQVRDPNDVDTISPDPMFEDFDNFWSDRLLDYGTSEYWSDPYRYATLDELYTMKVSHAYWEIPNGSWNKHMYDTVLLKANGAKLNHTLHDILYDCWTEIYGPKKMKFMAKDEFFEDAVVRKYDHDSIHDSVAYGDEAMYIQTLKREGHTATSMDYIKAMDHKDQVKLYREEVAATALERIMIPSNYRGSPGAAWLWALRRTITSLTKGWSAQFIVTNYEYFVQPCDYVGRHLKKKDRLVLLDA